MAYGMQRASCSTTLPAVLQMSVPHVGSGPQAHSMALDKVIGRITFEAASEAQSICFPAALWPISMARRSLKSPRARGQAIKELSMPTVALTLGPTNAESSGAGPNLHIARTLMQSRAVQG